VYLLPPNAQALPDLDRLRPVSTIYAQRLNVPARQWLQGFPGIPNRFEWFAIAYEGVPRANYPGRYSFRLTSDDGSKLFIDEKWIIDNDGIHDVQSRSGSALLDDRPHRIRAEYYQGPRYWVALDFFAPTK
jgi:hypothetical protein